ncbi:MAG: NAD(P)/FAD-dependent oxidoreductase [Infirmifilum sp.]
MKEDVLIIGSGSAGLQSARAIIENTDLEVVVVEEHKTIGLPEHCTGLVSLEGIREALRVPPSRMALNYFRGAHLYSPGGITLTVEKKERVAAVINRPLYEHFLEDVISHGAKILLNTKGEILGTKAKVGEAVLEPRYIIDATGIRGLLSRNPASREWMLPALQYDIKAHLEDVDHVHVFLGSKFSRGLFAWAVPIGDNVCRIGVASKGNTLRRLEYLLRRLDYLTKGRVKPISRMKVLGGVVYTGGLRQQISGNVLLVGDSAGQTKPTTGGGLVYHSLASRFLAEALKQEAPPLYESKVRMTIGKEIQRQLLLRKLLNVMDDEKLDELFLVLKRVNGEEFISTNGDMDMQTKILYGLGIEIFRKNPTFYLGLLPLLFNFFIT